MRVKYCLVCLSIERTGEATIVGLDPVFRRAIHPWSCDGAVQVLPLPAAPFSPIRAALPHEDFNRRIQEILLKQCQRSQEGASVVFVLGPRGNRDELGAIDDVDGRDDSAATGGLRSRGHGDGFTAGCCGAQHVAPAD